MVVIQKLREMDRSRWVDQVIGSILSTILIGCGTLIISFASDFASVPSELKALKSDMKQAVLDVRADMDRRTAERKQADADINKRMDMADEMHVKIIQEHREIREAIPYSINRTLDRGRREGAAR